MAQRHMKICSISLAIGEMQIKTTTRYHLTPAKMAIINKQVLVRMWRKGNPSALLTGMQTGAVTVESRMEFPQKVKNELPFDLVIPLLGIYPKNLETPIQKKLCTPMFIGALFRIAKSWKQPK